MSNAAYGKTTKKLRNKIDLRLVSNEKYYFQLTSKPSYIWQKIFGNDLVPNRKSKDTLMLNKPAYVGICILDLSKVLMHEFHWLN